MTFRLPTAAEIAELQTLAIPICDMLHKQVMSLMNVAMQSH